MSLAHSTNQSLLPFSLARFTTSSPLALSHAFPQLGYASKSLLNSKLVRYGTAIFIFMKARVFLQNIFFGRSLKGEVAVITGAGSGIGKRMALDLARQGVKLALWDISESVNETAREVTEAGGTAKAYINDVSDRGSVYATAKSVLEDFGKVDILFNNAGIVSGKALLDVPDGLAEKTLQVNSISHFWTVKAFLPQMIERDHGKIVTIASAAGLVGVAGLCDYCASKYAAIGFNEALRLELRKQKKWGVSTTLVCPYYINTGMFDGVKTPFPFNILLPVLDPNYVSSMVIAAVKRNQEVIRIPRLMYISDLMHFALPVRVKDWIFEFIGFSNSMDDFHQTRNN